MQLDSFVFYAGPVRDYYLNDTLQMEGVYSNEGYKDGIFSFYYPDGILKAQGNFTRNAMYGPWKYYYSNGFLKAIVHYAGDESSFIVLDYFDSSGKQLTKDGTGKFEMDMSSGYGESQFKLTGEFVQGKREGTWNFYKPQIDANLFLAFKEKYNNGKFKHGETSFHSVYYNQPFVISSAFHFKFYSTETFSRDELSFQLNKAIDTNQSDRGDTSIVFITVEIQAAFPGGEREWRRYLERNLNPSIPVDKGAPAGTYTVVVEFIVDRNGAISGLRPLTNHGYGMEQEVLRIISKGPNWVPAIQNGRNVRSYRKQPITFIVGR